MASSFSVLGSLAFLSPLLALPILSGSSVVSDPEVDCLRRLNAFEEAYRSIRDAGSENWKSLLPQLESTKHCFGDTHSSATALLTDYETSILFKLNRYEATEAAFARFFENDAPHASPSVLATMYQRRASLYANTDRPLESLQDYVTSATFIYDLPPPKRAEFLIRIGNRFRGLGNFDAASSFYLQADSVLTAQPAEDARLAPVRARLLANQAAAYLHKANRGHINRRSAATTAGRLLEEALASLPEDDPDYHHERVQSLLWLAYAYRNMGEPQRALPIVERAHSAAMATRDRYPSLLSWAYTERGRSELALGNLVVAETALQKALELDRESGRPDLEMESLVDMGLLAEAVADASDSPSYDLAKAYYARAIALAELDRRAFGSLEWSAAVFEGLLPPYRNLIRLLLREGRYDEAFLLLDETRARYLQDLRLTNRIRPLLDEARRLRLDSLESARAAARYKSLRPDISAAENSAFIAEMLSAQTEASLLLGFEPPVAPALSVPLVQRALHGRDQTLITYFLEEGNNFAFVVRPDTLVGIQLGPDSDSLETFLDVIGQSIRSGAPAEAAREKTTLETLYRILIEPLEHLLPPEASLVFVPEGPLTGIPFAALARPAEEALDSREPDFLGRRHPISMELSAALITEAESPLARSPLNDLLALGRSEFGHPSPPDGPLAGTSLPNLPNVPSELQSLRRLFPSGRIMLNAEATENALYDEVDDALVVHLASHAVFNPAFPMFSYISLWADGNEDGAVFLYELQNQSLSSELVVLSGCGTARGEQHLGEGMIGLQHAFRAAGARSTLATLWQVEDEAMSTLMALYYRHLKAGQRKDRALQLAQAEYLDEHAGMRASPFFWASAVLYGSPAPVAWRRTYLPMSAWALVAALLLALGVGIPRLLRWRRFPGAWAQSGTGANS